jgi:hypothetical protein
LQWINRVPTSDAFPLVAAGDPAIPMILHFPHLCRRVFRAACPRARSALIALGFALSSVAVVARDGVYVSPGGDDRASGNADDPVATLERAVELMRAVPADAADASRRIILHGGTYRLGKTLALGPQDNPGAERTVSFEAYPGEHPVISGGVPVTQWRRLGPEEAPELPSAARAHVWVADLPARDGGWHFRTLYAGFSRLPRARSPEYLARGKHRGLFDRLEDRDVLEYPAGSIRPWKQLDDVEILCRPNHYWLVNYLGIASIDEQAGTLRTTVPATYTPTGRFWVENVLEVLDAPGEWVLDSHARRLYLWPRGDRPGTDIVAPILTTLIRVGGREDYWGDQDEPAHGFRFLGLTFAHTDRDVWRPADAGLQHDWAMWDKDDACLRFRVARDCEVRDCTFEAAGGQGVRADLYAQRIRITGSMFRNLGAGGVLLCGYGPGTKDVNRGNEITDNEFHDLGELWWHSPAIFLWQSGGNRVTHNYVHDLPYNGIVLSGVRPRYFGVGTPKIPRPTYPPALRENLRLMRWREIGNPRTVEATLPFAHTRGNLIADNEIRDVMRVLADGNAIYVSAAGKDNVIRRNVAYNMGGAAAIRTDDDQSYCSITQNVTFGVGIVIKDFNAAWNNIMINGGLRITSDRPDARIGQNVYFSYVGPIGFYMVDIHNSYFGNAANDTMLGNCNARHQAVVPPRTDHNLFYSGNRSADAAFVAGMQKQWGNDLASVIGDPGFRDAAHGDFRFAPDSPAAALGIESVDTTHVGLLREPMVERLKRTGGIDLRQCAPSKDRG